jgi:predicted AAA+ superfamily ATPase
MVELLEYHERLISEVPFKKIRFLYEKINWNERMIAVKGPRGSGKTTLLLQRIKEKHKSNEALYVNIEHPWFYNNTLFDTVNEFYLSGGRYIYIDEIHKYPQWSRELKVIYDGFPKLQIIFSASSALNIYRGEADLSRRVISYYLPGLSFREYLDFKENIKFPKLEIEQIIEHHNKYCKNIIKDISILPLFRKYLKYGYLPIILDTSEDDYLIKLMRIINAVIDLDLSYIDNYNSGTAFKIKKILGVLAESVPFKPNISAIARKLGLSRDSVYAYIKNLEEARLLNFLIKSGKGVSTLQKPEKLFFENTNLAYALRTGVDIGSVRETFLLNQLMNSGQSVRSPKTGDFLLNDKLLIEVGGKDKTFTQRDYQFIIAADNIEIGFGKKVPLWLFGFLY